jgi:type I restriction enzyme S subunit
MIEGNGNLPAGWRTAKLGDVCELNPRRSQISRLDDEPTTFLPMPAIGEGGAGIKRAEMRPYGELRKGYTSFVEGDVLFAKITPCMQNAKHAIARDLTDGIGFGSTEFHVLRPRDEIISEWIHYFLLQPSLLADATRYFTGAVGQQRVPDDYLSSLEIPLPPLEEQRRIATRLREQLSILAEARAALEAQLAAAESLPAAHLRAVFESEEADQWPRKRLEDVSEITGGVTLGRDFRGRPTRNVPYLRVANVKDGYLDLSNVKTTPATDEEIEALVLRRGDILLTEGGDADKLGRGTFWNGEIPDCIHQNHIFRLRFDTSNFEPAFVAHQFSSPYGKSYFFARAKQTTGIATINRQVLGAFPLLSPRLVEQRTIAAQLDAEFYASAELLRSLRTKLADLEKLPAALLREAFSPSCEVD